MQSREWEGVPIWPNALNNHYLTRPPSLPMCTNDLQHAWPTPDGDERFTAISLDL